MQSKPMLSGRKVRTALRAVREEECARLQADVVLLQ